MSIRRYWSCLLAVSFICVTPVFRSHVIAQDQANPAEKTEKAEKSEQAAGLEEIEKSEKKESAEIDAKEAKDNQKDTKSVEEDAAGIGIDDENEDATEAIAMRHQLELLQVRRQRLGLNFGEAHPTILRLNDEIKTLEKNLEAEETPKDLLQRADPKALESMNEEELRELVGELAKRVLVLEKEVHTLKELPTISRRFPR